MWVSAERAVAQPFVPLVLLEVVPGSALRGWVSHWDVWNQVSLQQGQTWRGQNTVPLSHSAVGYSLTCAPIMTKILFTAYSVRIQNTIFYVSQQSPSDRT